MNLNAIEPRVFVTRQAGTGDHAGEPPPRIVCITEYSSPLDTHDVELTLDEARAVYLALGALLKEKGKA